MAGRRSDSDCHSPGSRARADLLAFKYYQDVLKSPLGLADVRERLTAHGGWRKAYFGHLRRALAWVDKGLGPSAWSADSYDFTLKMAFIYPFASLFIVWLVTGQNTSGISDLLPENLSVWRRALTLAAVCPAAFFGYRFGKAPSLRNCAYFLFAVAVAVAFAFAVAGAGAGAFAGVVAVPRFQEFMNRRGLQGLFYWLYIASVLGFLALVCAHPAWFPRHYETLEFILIFLILLPLINSIFDWLSLASTRWLLKGMAIRDYASAYRVAGNAIIGVGFGVVLLAGLAVTITAALQTMNQLSQGKGGSELFDLAGTLHRLRTNPSDVSVWWVYLTLFSTMLPTVFHATVASASFVTWRLPDSWKTHWLNLIAPPRTSRMTILCSSACPGA